MATMDSRRLARTVKGHDEISNRSKSLKGKMRTVLFLVDPNKPADAVSQQVAMIGGPPDALAQLLAQGYIEEVGARVQAAQAASALPTVPAATSGEDEVAYFRVAKAFMNDTIVDTLGIRAFGFTLRLERCATRADLAGILPDYTEALAKKLDRNAVLALVERTRELLGAGRG
jgi:DNA-binding FrmR family transcriptional regulator